MLAYQQKTKGEICLRCPTPEGDLKLATGTCCYLKSRLFLLLLLLSSSDVTFNSGEDKNLGSATFQVKLYRR